MSRNTRNIHLDVPLQKIIRLKQTLLDNLRNFFGTIGGPENINVYIHDDIGDFASHWKHFLTTIKDILDFCYRHGIILEYKTFHLLVPKWSRDQPEYREDSVNFHMFRKYLVSNFITSPPEGAAQEFEDYHRQALVELDVCDEIAKYSY
jgi:hypothetical protein